MIINRFCHAFSG